MGLCGSARCGCQFQVDDSAAVGITLAASGTGEVGDPYVVTVTTNLATLLEDNIDGSTLTVVGGNVEVADGGLTVDKFANEAWSTWSVAWTSTSGSPAIGNGTLQGRYRKMGYTYEFEIVMVAGSTTTFGGAGGVWAFDLPTGVITPKGASSYAVIPFYGLAYDDSGGTGEGVFMGVRQTNSYGNVFTTASFGGVTPSVPWTWAVNDSLVIKGTVEVD